jgi:hypothetical protein
MTSIEWHEEIALDDCGIASHNAGFGNGAWIE